MSKQKFDKKVSWWLIVPAILIPQSIGNLGAIFTIPNIDSWYATLVKPSFSPPNYLFAPVWLTLYTLMGVALFLVWKTVAQAKRKRQANYIFTVQILLNLLWSIVFFGLQQPGNAFIVIVALLALIVLNINSFYQINKLAGWLLVPYLLWVSFASILNLAIWQLN